MEGITINPKPATWVINPFGFQQYAKEFLVAARSIPMDKEYSPVVYYLYCHAFELSLKAYLLASGQDIDYLKNKIGHNLVRLISKAKQIGIEKYYSIDCEQCRSFILLNKYYKTKSFEYFQLKNIMQNLCSGVNLPNPKILDKCINDLLNSIEKYCLNSGD
jgi:hypothetical protein